MILAYHDLRIKMPVLLGPVLLGPSVHVEVPSFFLRACIKPSETLNPKT